MIRSIADSVGYHWRERGPRGVFSSAVSKASRLLASTTEWVVYVKQASSIRRRDMPGFLSVREATVDELIDLGFGKAQAYPRRIEERLTRGERCFAFLAENSLAHVAWLADGYLPLEQGVPGIQDSRALGIYDCYTMPAHRRRGIYRAVLFRLCEVALDVGREKVLICVEPDNLPSIGAIEKTGFQLHARATAKRRFGLLRTAVKPVLDDGSLSPKVESVGDSSA